jgi:membrane protease YdiL (CAAX protease family)
MLSEKPWKPEALPRYMLAMFISIFLGELLATWLNSSHSPFAFDRKSVALIVGTLSFHGMALLLTFSFLREHGTDWSTGFGFASPRLGRSLLLAVVVGFAVVPIVGSLGQLSARIMSSMQVTPVVQESVKALQIAESLSLKITGGFLVVIVAPFAEELIFRGILYPTVKQFGFPRLALWGTSILFAAIHFNAMIFVPFFFLGVILTLLYETTDNLLAPIVTHGLFNLANFFWLMTQPGPR